MWSLNFVLCMHSCISHLPLQHFQREVELSLACQILRILVVSLHWFCWGLVLFVLFIQVSVDTLLPAVEKTSANRGLPLKLHCFAERWWVGTFCSLCNQDSFQLESLTASQKHSLASPKCLTLGICVQSCGYKLILYHTKSIALDPTLVWKQRGALCTMNTFLKESSYLEAT